MEGRKRRVRRETNKKRRLRRKGKRKKRRIPQ